MSAAHVSQLLAPPHIPRCTMVKLSIRILFIFELYITYTEIGFMGC